jgi:hypothetical protein
MKLPLLITLISLTLTLLFSLIFPIPPVLAQSGTQQNCLTGCAVKLPPTLPTGTYKLTMNFSANGSNRIIYSDYMVFQANNDQKNCSGKCFITIPKNLPSNLTRKIYLTKAGSRQILALQIDNVTTTTDAQGQQNTHIIPLCYSADGSCSSATGDTSGCKVDEVKTSIGCVPTPPPKLAGTALTVALGVGGAVALLLMALASFRLIRSRGNAEEIKKARDLFASAVVGLLFIILGTLILQLITVDILNIPGFTR